MDMEREFAKDLEVSHLKAEPDTKYPFKLILESDGVKEIQGAEALAKVLERIVDNVYSGIIVCDSDSKILYINKFYADLLQTTREKAIGRHIKLLPRLQAPGRA